jgi:hypothetical protein
MNEESVIINQLRAAFRAGRDTEMEAALLEVKRMEEVLASHRRFHGTVGCPGRPECYVCAEEEFWGSGD